jgi:hypothetical protein
LADRVQGRALEIYRLEPFFHDGTRPK